MQPGQGIKLSFLYSGSQHISSKLDIALRWPQSLSCVILRQPGLEAISCLLAYGSFRSSRRRSGLQLGSMSLRSALLLFFSSGRPCALSLSRPCARSVLAINLERAERALWFWPSSSPAIMPAADVSCGSRKSEHQGLRLQPLNREKASAHIKADDS